MAKGNNHEREQQLRSPPDVAALMRQRMAALRISQAELAERVGRRLETTFTQGAAWKWLREPTSLTPDKMFAIEIELGVAPGTWSRHLGFLPVEVVPSMSTIEAIERDPKLDDFGRRLLVGQYEILAAEVVQRRQRRQ